MIRVEFENSRGVHREIGTAEDEQGANKVMMDFLAERNFKSYYTRYWRPQPNHTVIDVGSWSEYFHFYEV